jgi:hypothetical protein
LFFSFTFEYFIEFYKELNQKTNQKDTPNIPEPEIQETNQINKEINKYIDKNEILNCIKKLKCNKASGEDYITRTFTVIIYYKYTKRVYYK